MRKTRIWIGGALIALAGCAGANTSEGRWWSEVRRAFDDPSAGVAMESVPVDSVAMDSVPMDSAAMDTQQTNDSEVPVVPVVLASAAPTPAPSGPPTVTLVNVPSAPVPESVFTNIAKRLKKAGFQVIGPADGDYLVICGRFPRRTVWGSSIPLSFAPTASFVRATSLEEPPGVRLDRPDGGRWQAIVEVAFERNDYNHPPLLCLREIHTIYSLDVRKAGSQESQRLSRLNEALYAWGVSYGIGVATR